MKKFFSSKTNIILTLILSLAIIIASILVVDLFKKEIIVEDFSSYTEAEILNWAKEKKAEELIKIDHEYSETYDAGKVIYQSIKPGEVLSDKLNITISLGKDPNSLIDLFVITDSSKKDDVEKWAFENGLTNVHYQYILSDKEVDSVISINKNSAIKSDEDIIVSLSCGENEDDVLIVVPDFSILSKEDISLWASGYDIEVTYTNKEDSNLPNDSFISQIPIKYSEIKNGSKVEIVLSIKRDDVVDDEIINVPDNLLWLSEKDFIAEIEKLGLKAAKQSKTYKKEGKENGCVYSYDSSSDGIKFKKGDSVKYWLVDNGTDGKKIIVPDDYLGLDEATFIKNIEALGLKALKQSQEYSSKKYNAGTIYAYDSSSDGINFVTGDSVKYWLVKGGSTGDSVTVPDTYLGLDETTFIKNIEALGLKVSKQSQTYSSQKYKPGTIYSYDSSGDGIKFKKGDTVKYWLVSGSESGNERVIVPDDYLGLDEATFIKNIETLGLKVSKQSKTYSSKKYKAGTIYAYDSSSDGIIFKKGDTVKYYLVETEGSTTEYVTVPDTYLGLDEATFIKNIEALGLKVSKQSQTYSSQKYKAGTIYSYDSSGDGIKFKKGDTVKYWLVKSETESGGGSTAEKISLKNLVGSSKAEAESYCSQNGLYTNFSEQNSSTAATGTIISMSPGSGSQVAKGSTISFVISKGEAVAWLVSVDKLASMVDPSSYDDTVAILSRYFNEQGFTNYGFSEDLQTSKSKGVVTGCTVNGATYSQGNFPLDARIVVSISNRKN